MTAVPITFRSEDAIHLRDNHYGIHCFATGRSLGLVDRLPDGRWLARHAIGRGGELIEVPDAIPHTHWRPCLHEMLRTQPLTIPTARS